MNNFFPFYWCWPYQPANRWILKKIPSQLIPNIFVYRNLQVCPLWTPKIVLLSVCFITIYLTHVFWNYSFYIDTAYINKFNYFLLFFFWYFVKFGSYVWRSPYSNRIMTWIHQVGGGCRSNEGREWWRRAVNFYINNKSPMNI